MENKNTKQIHIIYGENIYQVLKENKINNKVWNVINEIILN